MKSILISIQPKWCELIASGKKTVEVRNTKPKIDTPFKCYIYCTKDKHGWFDFLKKERLDGKVIGEFVCDDIIIAKSGSYCDIPIKGSCVSAFDLLEYADGKAVYGWHISDLVIYDKPKELSEFKHWKKFDWWDYGHHKNKPQWELRSLSRPPQSWCYVEEVKADDKR